MIDQYPNINTANLLGRTPLHNVALKTNYSMQALDINILLLEFLLNPPNDQIANTDARTMGGEDPLISAVMSGKREIVEIMLNSNRFGLNACNVFGETALHIATQYSPNCVDILLGAEYWLEN